MVPNPLQSFFLVLRGSDTVHQLLVCLAAVARTVNMSGVHNKRKGCESSVTGHNGCRSRSVERRRHAGEGSSAAAAVPALPESANAMGAPDAAWRLGPKRDAHSASLDTSPVPDFDDAYNRALPDMDLSQLSPQPGPAAQASSPAQASSSAHPPQSGQPAPPAPPRTSAREASPHKDFQAMFDECLAKLDTKLDDQKQTIMGAFGSAIREHDKAMDKKFSHVHNRVNAIDESQSRTQSSLEACWAVVRSIQQPAATIEASRASDDATAVTDILDDEDFRRPTRPDVIDVNVDPRTQSGQGKIP